MRVRRLDEDDLSLLGRIDRSEHVEVQLAVRHGRLVERPVVVADIPPWSPDGGEHSVAGLAVVHPTFEPPLAWLALLHVSRPHRRTGAGIALWAEAARLAGEAGATSLYVSATSTGSAVGFYLAQGCRLADPVHPELFALEPVDVHLVRRLR